MSNRIILVEDDIDLAQLTSEYLTSHGFEVTTVHDGEAGVETILSQPSDIVLLDIMLPKLDGMEVCRKVRDQYKGPIMMLTAREDQIDQIIGLEIGADDYVFKSSEPRLVLAKIKSLLRRSQINASALPTTMDVTLLDFGTIRIDPGSRVVVVNEAPITISNPEYELLLLLAQNAGVVLSREQIFESLRGIQYDGQNRIIDITISQLRSKLDFSDRIKTVRNKGYQFTNQVIQK
ncbi:response regulator [Marinicellulosiphila megalodicopiae]|uniref:response regulator n=1 Tax=Marinicellulosiphila megalodicopiae TaxID=2724896 RepID=UPI003BAFA652